VHSSADLLELALHLASRNATFDLAMLEAFAVTKAKADQRSKY
jgi:hypothetical protein